MNKQPYILWLPSWYPNEVEPYNGDFIQRHAYAAAGFASIKVLHFVQAGPGIPLPQKEEKKITGNLTEVIFYPAHTPVGFKFFNKVIYNYRFYKQGRKRLKAFFAEHGLPAGVHVHVPVKAGNLALWIRRKWGVPFVVSEQSSYYMQEAPDAFFVRSKWHQVQVRRIFQNAVAVTNVSATIGKVLQQLFQLKKITVIHNTVDTKQFFYKPNNKIAPFTFLHVSVLNEQKNIKGILDTFEQLSSLKRDWRLVLAGPVSNELSSYIKTLSCKENIELRGMIGYHEVAAEMQAANAFVLFSRHENFPCVVVEALCCGLPVIAADVAGVGEAVSNKNGILIGKNNEAALLAALKQMMADDQRFDRPQIAAAAKQLYSFETIGAQIFNLYRSKFGIGQ